MFCIIGVFYDRPFIALTAVQYSSTGGVRRVLVHRYTYYEDNMSTLVPRALVVLFCMRCQ